MTISTLGIDADDTLWHSESHFAVTEERFRDLVSPWLDGDDAGNRLLERERSNLRIFGYGVKGFTLSMVETAIESSKGTIGAEALQQIIDWGKEMLDHPVELLPGVSDTIDELQGDYRLVLITKGDLFHQESKIAESGLAERFEHIEILSEKSPAQYRRVLDRYGVEPAQFLMAGNSLRSDVLPVIDIGAQGAHIPYGITWGHEKVDCSAMETTWHQLDAFSELPELLNTLDDRPR